MSVRNSRDRRTTRRAGALARFKLDPARASDADYQKRKAEELEALKQPLK